MVTEEKTQEQQDDQPSGAVEAQSVEFSEVGETHIGGKGASIDLLLDIEVPVTVAIGKTEIPIQRLLQLKPGSVLKLDKPIDMPAELYLKNTMFATGSIVVLEDKFAVKIKKILTNEPTDKPQSK